MLAFWFRTPEAVDRVFRTSGLYREKWDRDDYREGTLAKAFDGRTEFYDPDRNRRSRSTVACNGDHRSGGPAVAAPGGDGRPHIICGSEDPREGLKTWTPAAMKALAAHNSPPFVFQRGRDLVRLVVVEKDAPPVFEPLGIDSLRGIMDRAACWGTECLTKNGTFRTKFGPPRLEVIRDMLALPSWDAAGVPRVDLVVESPRFLPDGRLITTPGYHAEGRIYYAPPGELADISVPDRPTADDMEWALDMLLENMLRDFVFKSQASKANALALTLLPFVRPMIAGPTPLHHIGAATEGTGKSLLATTIAYPALGREINNSPQKEDEAEWRKASTSMLMSGVSHFFIDNMYNPLGWDDVPLPVDSGTLAMLLTAPFYCDRILGGNKEARIRIHTVFMSSGNNVFFSRELTRRIVPIDLLAATENPSLRTGFRHDPLIEAFVAPRRQDLLHACLLLCQNWIAMGKPPGKQVMGRYEGYARTLGGILDCCGVKGFLANRSKMIGKNTESTRWQALVTQWEKAHGTSMITSGDLYDLIIRGGDLAVAFAEIIGDGKELSQRQRLGKALEKQDGRIWGEWRIHRTSARARNGAPVYRLLSASEAPQEAECEGDTDTEDFVSGEPEDFIP
jgi:putative DNA primase/helicase